MYILADYKCSKCGHEDELMAEARGGVFPLHNCPECGGVGTFAKVASAVRAIYKGEGFPTNDGRKK